MNILLDQLTQLYGTSLAAVICRNSDAITSVQKFVMKRLGENNPIIDCSEIDKFSFEPWREQPYRLVSVATSSQMSAVRVFTKL